MYNYVRLSLIVYNLNSYAEKQELQTCFVLLLSVYIQAAVLWKGRTNVPKTFNHKDKPNYKYFLNSLCHETTLTTDYDGTGTKLKPLCDYHLEVNN